MKHFWFFDNTNWQTLNQTYQKKYRRNILVKSEMERKPLQQISMRFIKTTRYYLKKHIFHYIRKSKRDEFFRRKMAKVR